MKSHKILLLSVSAGAGHVRASEALDACAKENFKNIETLHLDVMDYVPATFRKLYVDSYLKLVQHFPSLWGAVYKVTTKANPDDLFQKVRRAAERLNTRALSKAIENFKPDAIICTHFLPAELLMHKINKGDFNTPVWVQITDFDLHRMWVMPHMAGYFTANEEVKFRLEHHNIASHNIHVTGIPVMPAFVAAKAMNKADACTALGLNTQHPVLLLMGGGAGMGRLDDVAAELLEQDKNFQLIVLAGRNKNTLDSLQQLATRYPGRLFPQGFTNHVEKLMICADLVITKPGGLTTSECLALGLPIIVHAPIPGQEEHNADYLMEQGAALKAIDAIGLAYRVRELMAHPERLTVMHQKAAALGKPDAAKNVLSTVIAALG